MKNHFSAEMESLRGIAALFVLTGHFYLFTMLSVYLRPSSKIMATLIAGIFDPQPAVLLFFTISGFALGRQLRKEPVNNLVTYLAYLCRRIFRLLPLVWASIIFAYVLANLKGASISFLSLMQNLILQDISLNAPLWSLQVELYCSIFFPLLFWIFAKSSMTANAILFSAFCVLSYFWQAPIFIQYFVFFHAGLLMDYINANGKKNIAFVNPFSLMFFYLVFILSPEFSMGSRNWSYGCWQSWVLPEILACSFIVFFVIHNSWLNHFLSLSFMRYLGKISFSIYLFHFPLLFFMMEKIRNSTPLQFLGFTIAYFAAIVSISSLSYRWIELPANKLGKILSSALLARYKRTANHTYPPFVEAN